MEKFAEVIKGELEERVGEAFLDRMSPEQGDEFMEEKDDEKVAEWLKKNFPDYRGVITEIAVGLKDEVLKYKKEIPGLTQSIRDEWNGRPIDELKIISQRECRLFKENGFRTYGEIYSMDYDTLLEILGQDKEWDAVRIIEGVGELNRTLSF